MQEHNTSVQSLWSAIACHRNHPHVLPGLIKVSVVAAKHVEHPCNDANSCFADLVRYQLRHLADVTCEKPPFDLVHFLADVSLLKSTAQVSCEILALSYK